MLPGTDTESSIYSGHLPAYLSQHYPGLRAREKFSFVADFAGFLSNLHERGVPSWQYHPSQVRVTVDGAGRAFALAVRDADLPGGSSLSPTLRRKGLITLLAGFLTASSRAERLRFYKAYWHDGVKLSARRTELTKLDRAAIAFARRKWRDEDRTALGSNDRFVIEQRGGFKIRRLRSAAIDQVLAHLLPEPESLFAAGKSLSRRGAGCASARIDIDGRAYFLKRYDGIGWGYQLKNVFRRSRARKVWQTSWGFLNRGLPVPQALILLEERRYRLLKRAYLLTEFQEEATPLMSAWPELTASEKDHFLARSAILLGRMHSFGCIHGDTNWENILIRDLYKDNRLLLVDLDCGRITRFLTRNRADRDIQHFVRDLLRPHIDGASKKGFFMQCWQRWLANPLKIRARTECQ